jgi:hypothetical protein
MKKTFLSVAIVLSLSACTDAQIAGFGALGENSKVTCYSGGEVVFEDISTGKVIQFEGGGLSFKSKTTGNYVRAFADCIVSEI